MNNCISLFKNEQEEKQFKELQIKSLTYTAQCMQCVVNGLYQKDVMTLFIDFVQEKPEETRTAEEIVDDVLEKCGLLGG